MTYMIVPLELLLLRWRSRGTLWQIQSLTSPFNILVFKKQESKCTMIILYLIFGLLLDIL